MSRDNTLDGFLGGRLFIAQPRRGFRAGHETVLLAASVPALAGSHVLELGSGAGIASLCLAWRVAEARVTGIEIDPELVALANENAERNGMADRVGFKCGDAASLGGGAAGFDHVFFNPPFHPASGEESPSVGRDLAMRDVANAIADWTRNALARTRPDGTVTAILRADRAEDMLAAGDGWGGVVLFPLFPRAGEAPRRMIVQFQKGSLAPRHLMRRQLRRLHEQDRAGNYRNGWGSHSSSWGIACRCWACFDKLADLSRLGPKGVCRWLFVGLMPLLLGRVHPQRLQLLSPDWCAFLVSNVLQLITAVMGEVIYLRKLQGGRKSRA